HDSRAGHDVPFHAGPVDGGVGTRDHRDDPYHRRRTGGDVDLLPSGTDREGLTGVLERTLDILGRLVACPTVSTHSNLDLVDYAVDLLEAAGAAIHTSFDSTGKKANVFATIGPDEGGGVVLSGHTDVVPTE